MRPYQRGMMPLAGGSGRGRLIGRTTQVYYLVNGHAVALQQVVSDAATTTGQDFRPYAAPLRAEGGAGFG